MSLVRVQCDALLSLYDTVQADGGFVTAISSLAGEELGLALLRHCLSRRGLSVQRLPGVPTTGRRSGFRLDRWMLLNGELMQVEVKN